MTDWVEIGEMSERSTGEQILVEDAEMQDNESIDSWCAKTESPNEGTFYRSSLPVVRELI